jgi:hypothetical protein
MGRIFGLISVELFTIGPPRHFTLLERPAHAAVSLLGQRGNESPTRFRAPDALHRA